MKKIIKFALIAFLTLSIYSCNEWLNVVPEGEPTIENAFNNRAQAERFLFTVYSYMPLWGDISAPGFFAGDEHWTIPMGTGSIDARLATYSIRTGMDAWMISRGEQSPADTRLNFWDGGRSGHNLWIGIRDAHIFLNNIHRPPDLGSMERDRWIAEATFLKAYYHFYLLKLYGPIPIMRELTEIYAPIEEIRRFRDPVDEVVDFIVETIDRAMENLPLTISEPAMEMGRITQPIAAAVRAQVLLFAASPLMNGNPYFANVVDSRGVHPFPREFDRERWARAAAAAREAIDIAHEAGHHLFEFEEFLPPGVSETTRRILSINGATTERWNQEIIWGETRASTINGHGLQSFAMAKAPGHSHWFARSLLAPTLDVAEQFHSSNGVPLEEDNSYFWTNNFLTRHSIVTIPDEGINRHILDVGQRTVALHLNRELRFYSNLFFSRGVRYQIPWLNDDAALARFNFIALSGAGGRTGAGEDFSVTGYLNRAVVSSRSSLTGAGFSAHRYAFPIIRLADLYLMYAEALNESLPAPNGTVHYYVDKVRARAGLEGVVTSWAQHSRYPNRPLTQEGMREIIRRERLIELSGEGHRFWDKRRWMIPLAQEVRGWNSSGETAEEFYQITVHFTRPRQTFRDFLWPIRTSSILINPNLMQNPGWN